MGEDGRWVEGSDLKLYYTKYLPYYFAFVRMLAEHDWVSPVQPKMRLMWEVMRLCTDETSLSVPSESSTWAGVFSSNFSNSSARSNLILVIARLALSILIVKLSFSASTSIIFRFRSLHFVR